jgi:hypothetical protein
MVSINISVTLFLLSAILSQPAIANIVITSHGIFSSCEKAMEYQEGPLLSMLDTEFERYSKGVQGRVESALMEFENHRENAVQAYKNADAEMKSKIALAVGKFIAAEVLSKAFIKLPPDVAKALTSQQKAALNAVMGRSAAMKVEILTSLSTGDFSKDIILQSSTSLIIAPLASLLGPVGLTAYYMAGVSFAAAGAYMDTAPAKNNAEVEALALAKAIEQLATGSPKFRLDNINSVKYEIDSACRKNN